MLIWICMLTKRTQILFDENIWKKLTQLARAQTTSVGQLIREAVKEKYLKEADFVRQRETLEEIERIRPRLAQKIDYKALINYGRKY